MDKMTCTVTKDTLTVGPYSDGYTENARFRLVETPKLVMINIRLTCTGD